MSPNKRTYGIIGKTLTHSFSPRYFAQKFIREQICDTEYLSLPIADVTQVRTLVETIPTLQGFNVTIPYKQEILPLLEEIDEVAATIGAVNCVLVNRENGKISLKGYNTDIIGVTQTLTKLQLPHPLSALILGTGGAAQSVKSALGKQQIPFTSVSRKANSNAISYEMLTPGIIRQHHLIINTTPLGMFPNEEQFPPINYHAITHQHTLIDLIYNPEETQFLKKGKQQGATICNGMTMLVAQAEASWEIWNHNF